MNRLLVCMLSSIILASSCVGNCQQNKKEMQASYKSVKLDSIQLIRDLEYLSSPALEGRLVGTEGNKLARNYIASRFDSLQVAAPASGRFQNFPARDNATGVNVLGLIKGSIYPDQFIIISAHYDHLGKRGDKIYTGADDNASGSAALMALAAWFKKNTPEHSIIFAAFDAEEGGLMGSKYFADHPGLDINSVIFNLNMDMVSRNDKNEIYVSGTFHYPFLAKYIDSIRPLTSITVSLGHDDPSDRASDWTSQSDHYPFHQKKIPFLYFGVEDHPDYHQHTDSFEKINKSFYYRVCNMIAATAALIDEQQQLQ